MENKAKSSKKALKLETLDRPLTLYNVDGQVSHNDKTKIIRFSSFLWTVIYPV